MNRKGDGSIIKEERSKKKVFRSREKK